MWSPCLGSESARVGWGSSSSPPRGSPERGILSLKGYSNRGQITHAVRPALGSRCGWPAGQVVGSGKGSAGLRCGGLGRENQFRGTRCLRRVLRAVGGRQRGGDAEARVAALSRSGPDGWSCWAGWRPVREVVVGHGAVHVGGAVPPNSDLPSGRGHGRSH